jgi:sec-independent protein translocase protein TatA
MELLSPMHLLIIFFVALLIFGPKKLPELGKGIGEGFRALKEGMKDKPAEQATTQPTSTSNNPEVKS